MISLVIYAFRRFTTYIRETKTASNWVGRNSMLRNFIPFNYIEYVEIRSTQFQNRKFLISQTRRRRKNIKTAIFSVHPLSCLIELRLTTYAFVGTVQTNILHTVLHISETTLYHCCSMFGLAFVRRDGNYTFPINSRELCVCVCVCA